MGGLRDKSNETVCDKDMCNGCGACVSKCPLNAIAIQHEMFSINAMIDSSKCISCNACKKVCPNVTEVKKCEPNEWKRGWANNPEIRKKGSSGGILSAVTAGFIGEVNYVCTCIYDSGEFKYVITNDLADLSSAPGSKYVKSDPSGAYEKVRKQLQAGSKVLFIGLPCHVAGILNYIGHGKQNLYTVDMLCHGTPSKALFNLFLSEHGVSEDDILSVSFREKTDYEISINRKYFSTRGTLDYYSIAFINGLSYTDNCYNCKYATVERISDITVADSWIEDEYRKELKQGISLILVNSGKGKELLDIADVTCVSGYKDKEIETKPELSHPTIPLGNKNGFRKDINNGKRFNYAVIHALPYKVFKQKVKGLLLNLGILHAKGGGNL